MPSFHYRAVCSPFCTLELSPPPSPHSPFLSHSPSHDQSTQIPRISDANYASSWELHDPDSQLTALTPNTLCLVLLA